MRTLEQLMNYAPGYQSYRTDQAGFSHVYSSRSRRGGSDGREVLILYDGLRLNSDWAGGTNLFDGNIIT